MKHFSNRYTVKIPNNIEVFHCSERQIVLINGPLGKKLLNLKVHVEICHKQNLIRVLSLNIKKKASKNLCGTTVALLKQSFLDVSTTVCKKLNLVGVGFKALLTKTEQHDLIHLKLGYSHGVYFKIPESIDIKCHKSDKLFVFGSSWKQVTQTAAQIRNCKVPEPYKGKGISYSDEVIKLKEGKKV